MANYPGSIIPSGLQADDQATFADALSGFEVDYWPPHASDPLKPVTGSLTRNVPVILQQSAISGSLAPAFGRDWFDRIHIGQNVVSPGYAGAHLVNPVDVGNLLSTQQRLIEVWNGHFSAKTLAQIIPENASGISLEPQTPGLPAAFSANESRIYVATITTTGSPVIDALYTFEFPEENPLLRLIGRRVVAFVFPPNWKNGIHERLEWLTDVMISRSGHEQRVALREIPRRRIEYEIIAVQPAYGRLNPLLASWQSRLFAIPIWTDLSRLSSGISAGVLSVPVDTRHCDYHAGGLAILTTDADTFEIVEIISLTPSAITLDLPLLASWTAGTILCPARLCRLGDSQPVSWVTDRVASARMSFEIDDNTNVISAESGLTHNGLPVYVRAHDWSKPLETEYRRISDRLDWETGPVTRDDAPDSPFTVRKRRHVMTSRSDIDAFKAWLHARQGKLIPFYMPALESLQVTSPIAAIDTAITIQPHDEELYLYQLGGHTDIALQHRNGTWYFRSVTGMTTDGSGTVIALNSAFGVAMALSDIARVCWLERVRLNADSVELHWLTNSVVTCELSTQVIIQ